MFVEVVELPCGLQRISIFEHSLCSVLVFRIVFRTLLLTAKQGDSLPLFLFGFSLEYSRKTGQEIQSLEC